MTNKRSLFGGALLSAGLSAGAASGQQLTFSYAYTVVGAYAYELSGPSYDTFEAGESWSISVRELDAEAFSSGSDTRIDLTARSGDAAGAFVLAAVDFRVSDDAHATATWDYAGDAYGISGRFTVDNLTDGVRVLEVSPFALAGSASFLLESGKTYQLVGFTFATGYATGDVFNRIEIPGGSTPGVAALAGLAALRRRR